MITGKKRSGTNADTCAVAGMECLLSYGGLYFAEGASSDVELCGKEGREESAASWQGRSPGDYDTPHTYYQTSACLSYTRTDANVQSCQIWEWE
jgi:hypothetical protein